MASSYPPSQSDSLSESEIEWGSDSNSSQSDNLSWIPWWCAHPGHEYYIEVPEDYIEDDFNMTGLSSLVPLYKEAIELILDLEPDEETTTEAADQATVEASAGVLYGLIHCRYICSRNGLLAMADKYEGAHFGTCPRTLCKKSPILPIGLSDNLDEDSMKLYCACCLDTYTPPNSRFYGIDGAFFGTSFPHLFFMTFPELLPSCSGEVYVPKIYGFKVSAKARSGPRMTWLREGLRTAENSDGSEDDSFEESEDEDELMNGNDDNETINTQAIQQMVRSRSGDEAAAEIVAVRQTKHG